jgi:hypothetical protein
VLVALVEQPGRLLSKRELIDKVWPDTFVEESNLTYNVFRLRKALGEAADSGDYIETVPRRGYRFTAPITPVNGGQGPQPRTEDPVKVLDGVVLGNFDVTDGGIYYIDRVSGEAGVYFTDRPSGETRLQYFDFATGQSKTVARNLGTVSFGLSASRDGRTVFFTRIDSAVDELMLVDNFR